jgi:hypothetical protein
LFDKYYDTQLIIVRSFVDRDILMCYHWGLGVGHVYAHQSSPKDAGVIWSTLDDEFLVNDEPIVEDTTATERSPEELQDDYQSQDDAESQSSYSEDFECYSGEESDSEEEESSDFNGDEELVLHFNEMYGDVPLDEYED